MRRHPFAFRPLLLAFSLFALCALPFAAHAQSATATLSGTVEDTNGAVVPGASITAVNNGTQLTRKTTTNEQGYFTIPLLPPGAYTLKAQAQGFAPVDFTDVVLNVGDQKALQIQLKAGDMNATVQVVNEAPLINESPAVGTVINRQFVENLPLNGRSFNTLLQLTPGVVIAPATGSSPGQFSVAGQRTDANNFLVDGVSANFGVQSTITIGNSATGQTQALSAIGGTSSLVSVEAMQEFRIETSSSAAEFGRAPGGQVIISTRSGTNAFHGGAYDYFRNDKLDANDWFNNAARQQRPPERHNDFGGFLGGPIVRNKTFFFFSYEGARLRTPSSTVTQVPSVAARSAVPALTPFLNAYPQPNGPVSANGNTAQFTGSFSNSATLDATSIRIDHALTKRFSLFGRYNDAPSQFLRRLAPPSNLAINDVKTRTLTIGLNMVISNRISNSVRANYSRQNSSFSEKLDSFGGAVPLDPKLLLGSLSSSDNAIFFGVFDASGLYNIGPNGRNEALQLNLVDDLAVALNSHQLKFGADYRTINFNKNSFQNQLLFTQSNIQTFLSTGKANLSVSTLVPGKVLTRAFSLYGQDSWKVTRRLTFTYGLRWELSPSPSPRGTTTLSAWTNVDNPSATALAPAGTPLWSTTHTNFAPRAAVAYNLTQKGDFVLRAGWGLYYDLGLGLFGDILGAFPNLASKFSPGVSLPVTDVTPFLPMISSQPPFPGVQGFRPDLKLPRSYQWNVAVEKSFWSRNAISATYVGQAGRRLLRREVINRPNPNFSSTFELTGNGGSSDYHALQLQYRRPLAARFQALANYTWSHSIDNASSDAVDLVSNIIFPGQNDRGSSSFDVRHSFSGSVSYSVPGAAGPKALALLTKDWFVDAIIVARSGFPFNASVLSVITGNTRGQRPDVVTGMPYWIKDSTVPGGQRLNPAAFTIPPTTRQGSERRNDIPGFGFTQIDLSVRRKFPITERVDLQLRAEAFNVFNHPNFTNPPGLVGGAAAFLQSSQMLNQGLGGLNPIFQQGGPRSLQLSLKLTF
jgi:carboxypeptidase family protein/TonB-dependent receptor-like protein